MKMSSRQFIHPDAVAIVPTTPGRLEGRDAYVAGWRSFAESAVVHEWKETDHKVQIYAGGKCAVVTNFFSITFAMGTGKQDHAGPGHVFPCQRGSEVAGRSRPVLAGTPAGRACMRRNAGQFLPV